MAVTEQIFALLADGVAGNAVRTEALQRAKQLGLPSKGNEQYLYTRVADVLNVQSATSFTADIAVSGSAPSAVVGHDMPMPEASLANAVAMVAAAAATDVLAIDVPSSAEPAEVNVKLNVNNPDAFAAARININVQANAEATIVMSAEGVNAGFADAIVCLEVGENAKVKMVFTQTDAVASPLFTQTYISAQANSSVNISTITLGAPMVRNDLHVKLAGQGAELIANGLYMAAGTNHIDNNVTVEHAVPHCVSNQMYKGVVDGNSTAAFAGRIIVAPHAQKTSADQVCRNMLLTEGAHAYAKPQLEIYADDVKCSHGATTGQLDSAQLFYMQQRGIDEATAKAMLTAAFVMEVVDKIPVQHVRDAVASRIENIF